MTSINYLGYEFTQTDNSDRYRILDADGKVVTYSYYKPNMSMSEAVVAIEQFIKARDVIKAVMG